MCYLGRSDGFMGISILPKPIKSHALNMLLLFANQTSIKLLKQQQQQQKQG